MTDLSKLPSIDQLINTPETETLVSKFGRTLCLKAFRTVLDDIRQQYIDHKTAVPDNKEILNRTRNQINDWVSPSLFQVINASGVVLHTNLGRAPLSTETQKALTEAAEGYSNLEFNLESGKRGRRSTHASQMLARLTGVESGMVVNNNAGAMLLVLSVLAHNKNVLISRSQLVEIGGGFRIPDVMRQSGANLVEIGTTNRVHLYDYEVALNAGKVALVLVAHHSNFKLIGFHSEPELQEIVAAAHHHKVPVVHDLGSGAMLNTEDYGLAHEPTVFESVQAGCDLVCFSGDKLLGGPQAGIIIGHQSLLKIIRQHPLARALRADKLTLAGINATLLHYLKDEAIEKVPVWQMIAQPLENIKITANQWREYLGTGEVIQGFSTVGGGSLPTEEMPTYLLALKPENPDKFMQAMRHSNPPIIARIEEDRVLLDPRTVLPNQENALLRNLLLVLETEAA